MKNSFTHQAFYLFLFLSLFNLASCQDGNNKILKGSKTMEPKHTNSLINETSPYLLQHAHNPVDWMAWSNEAFEKAKKENKLILISIGYSACHWCHVMEHESFEDEEVAKLMNEYFVCIKVDREERPEVDNIYMNAIQLMSQQGGWPLNCFALPDGKPIYGGTYFQKEQWKEVLTQLHLAYENDPQKVSDYAQKLTEGIQKSDLISISPTNEDLSEEKLDDMVFKWKQSFDHREGGMNRAPKFPLPNNYEFLMDYGHLANDKKISEHVYLTMKKMAYGGIYDQVGGGFSRYSTDVLWKAPHFEKMLYDNAQLVSLYSKGYLNYKDPVFKEIVEGTLEFVERELSGSEGEFYSALDADSEGEEGKFYVWKKEELKSILGEDYSFAEKYYNINSKGFWEHGNYILLRREDDEMVSKELKISLEELGETKARVNKQLFEVRSKRIRPGLDDKILTSWNAMMLKGYVDAYKAFGNKNHLNSALKNATFIINNVLKEDGSLYRSYKNGKAKIDGFLEDYCAIIDAFIALYEVSFDQKWIDLADKISRYCISHFHDEQSGFFFFTSDQQSGLIARKVELQDNVIPASNSVMANNLFTLGHMLDKSDYIDISTKMLKSIYSQMDSYGSAYSNWGILLLKFTFPYYEVAIVGEKADDLGVELNRYYNPNILLMGSNIESKLPLLENRYSPNETYIYVCQNKTCKYPVEKVDEALKLLE